MTRRRNARPGGGPAPSAEPRMRLREPVDVLAAIPYLVGYHPTESIILLGMQRRQLAFTAHYDLPTVDAPHRDVEEIIEHMLRVVLRQGLTGVLIVGFGTDERVRPLALAVSAAYLDAGLHVLEVLRADNSRYWSYLCSDPLCCPEDGAPYDSEASEVAAEWTVAGRVALPDRDSYERQIKPVSGAGRMSMRQATGRADDRLLDLISRAAGEIAAGVAVMQAGNAAINNALDRARDGTPLVDDDVAWLSVLVASFDVRDLAWAKIKGSGANVELHRTLWMDVLRRAEHDLTPAPGCLFAFASWRCGEGALARLALERVLELDPSYGMARLLEHVLAHGLPPSALDDAPLDRFRSRRSGPGRRKRSSSRRARSRRA